MSGSFAAGYVGARGPGGTAKSDFGISTTLAGDRGPDKLRRVLLAGLGARCLAPGTGSPGSSARCWSRASARAPTARRRSSAPRAPKGPPVPIHRRSGPFPNRTPNLFTLDQQGERVHGDAEGRTGSAGQPTGVAGRQNVPRRLKAPVPLRVRPRRRNFTVSTEHPISRSGRTSRSPSAWSIPTCKPPRLPPPDRTKARTTLSAGCGRSREDRDASRTRQRAGRGRPRR